MPLLFGRFQKLSTRPTGGETSSGLGLSIVKEHAQKIEASITCESEYGYGATFNLALKS
jgi:signal transduction histidine kinase